MKPLKALLLPVAIVVFAPYVHAQVASSVVVSSCGTPPQTYSAGTVQPQTQDTNGRPCAPSGTSTLGKVDILGNTGAVLDSTVAPASSPANGVAVTGQYLNNANQPAATTGQSTGVQTDPAGNLRTAPQRPTATDILDGYQTFTSTTSATTVITVAAGRTWVGTISANVACQEVGAATTACQARAVFTTSGTNVVPAAGTYFACEAKNGANVAAGTVGNGTSNYCATPFTIVAPAGNTVLIQVATTNAGTASVVDASAIGTMQ